MKDLYTEICDLSHQALENGTSADELVVILLSHALIAAKHLRLSKGFCQDEFDSAIEDIYGDEEKGEECCEKETHKASPEMQLFFEKLLKLKKYAAINKEPSLHTPNCSHETSAYWKGRMDTWGDVYKYLDEVIKEKE